MQPSQGGEMSWTLQLLGEGGSEDQLGWRRPRTAKGTPGPVCSGTAWARPVKGAATEDLCDRVCSARGADLAMPRSVLAAASPEGCFFFQHKVSSPSTRPDTPSPSSALWQSSQQSQPFILHLQTTEKPSSFRKYKLCWVLCKTAKC